ncbi:hypothetical protein [Priestia megaterium]|uniref:hypothetical protein n=1 Tax=Priestia megaterium TaxID=1404 RepID=UPI0014946DCA|nr:hypothetical protein [Priestia megaterium]
MEINKVKRNVLIFILAGILVTVGGFLICPKAHHTYQMMFTELGYWNDIGTYMD